MAVYRGTKGNDVYNGTSGNDDIKGGAGGDTLRGGLGNDTILGEDGTDYLDGQDGDDIVDGGQGTDQIFGGAGRDQLTGGDGDDRIDGGAGTDTAYFSGLLSDYRITTVNGVTTVTDLKSKVDGSEGVDTLTDVERLVFKNGQIVYLTPNVAPTAPTDANASANSVSEGAANGALVGITASSADPDADPVTYSLVNDAGGRFAINSTTGAVTVANASLLNYESNTSHTITVRASDGFGGTTDQTFTIAVTNVAPTAPADANPSTNSVSEEASNGATVGIMASSSDIHGGSVTYSLTDDAGGRFAIDSTTGVVTVADSSLLNYESDTSHQITVAASDGTTTTSSTFTIAVTNVAPVVPTDANAAVNAVSEGAGNGDAVGITASSSDVHGGTITYSLTDSAGGRFAIDPTTGVVTVANASLLNYESNASHNITIRASDGVGGTTDQTFAIAVTNVVPTAPTDSNAAANTVSESATNGTAIGITASSSDVNGGTVTYSLTDDAGGRFAINATTGVVTVANASLLNYETNTSHNITVRASDGVGGTTDQTFTIAVTNVAPAVPTDGNAAANTVSEGATNGTSVGITASSSDVHGGPVTYSLTDDAGGRFGINPTTGVVSVADASLLDYETATSHQITVQASDGTDTSSQAFTVNVANVAPAAPTDTTGTSGALVAEDLAVGSAVGITASSSDVNGGAVEYYFRDSGGNRAQTLGGFTVNAATGVVTLASALNYETATTHLLTIYAGDGTGENSSNFTVNVTNVAPTTPTGAGGYVYEGSSVGINIFAASSSDVNGGTVTYSLTDDAGGRFAINPTTGMVTVANSGLIDFESSTSHDITVQASDGTDTSSQTFTITVRNVPPYTPVDGDGAANAVAEGASNGDTVGITARSSDVSGGTVTYSLADDAGGRFAINPTTGVVTVADASLLDFESATSHDVTVQSSDGTDTSSQVFTINVSNAPPATGGAASANGSENDASIGGTVPAANDPNGATLTYAVVPGSVEVNGVAAPDGTITLNAFGTYSYTPGGADQALYDDESRTITFQYRASDGTALSEAALVTITIDGENDAPINAMPASYAATEDTARKLTGLSISDVDAGSRTMTVTLSVGGGSITATTDGVVGVSGSGTGSLELTGTIAQINAFLANSSSQPTYVPAANVNGSVTVTLTTSDGALTDEDTRSINIASVNDAPTDLSLSSSSVPEGIPGAVVGTLSAQDVDGDSLTYSIVSGLDGALFAIVGNELRVGSTPLDYEQATQYSVKVQVRDPSGATSVQTFIIGVEDRNEILLTTSTDNIPGASTNDLIIGTSATMNNTDRINGGDGFDQLLLYNSGTFDLRNLAQFTGIEEVRIANYSSSPSQLYLRAGEAVSVFTTNVSTYNQVFLNTGQVTYAGGDGTDYIYANSLSGTSWNTANVLTGGNGYDYLSINRSSTGTTDLRSATISNIEYMEVYDGAVIVDADAIAGFNYIYGNSTSRVTTYDTILDLTNKTVQSVLVASENSTGTLFKVNYLQTAFQIIGGAGDDTLSISGFTLSADQREAIFATSLIEHIVQGGVTYDAPTADPSVIKLTPGSDVIPAGAPDSVTVNTNAVSLNSGDNLNAGATGTDILQLYGSGSFNLRNLAGFSGFEEIRAINYSNDWQTVFLRDGVSATVTGIGTGGRAVYLGTGLVTYTGGDGSDQLLANYASNTSWNTANVLNGGNGYDYLSINRSSTGTTDLRSATISNIEYMEVYDGAAIVDADAIAGFNYIYGNSTSRVTTYDTILDLTNKTVQSVLVASENSTGTLFKVNYLQTAFQIIGGAGDDTLSISGFTLSADQREAIFATSLIEHIVQGGVTYDAPTADPSVIKLTPGSDVIPAGAPDSVTVNTNAVSLNSGDNLNAGATGTDILQLYGSGSFNLRNLAGFSGFEEIRAINYSNDWQTVFLRDGVSATVTGIGTGGRAVYLGTGLVTYTGGDGSDELLANYASNTSWNTANVLNGGNGYDYLSINRSSTGTTDLRSATISNIEYMAVYDGAVIVDADAIAGFNYIYGNSTSRITTYDTILDLTNKTVQSVLVASENSTGTLFKVNYLQTALQIVGGAGANDTIQAIGFNFTTDQRAAIFAGGQIEVLIDSTGIYGSSGPNDLQAAASGSTIFAGGGSDTLRSGAGDDILYGGSGADTFVFGALSGIDRVMDFDLAQVGEVIDISALTEIEDYADLVANHLTEVDGSAVINWSGGTITLQGIQVDSLSSGDFLF